MARYVDLSLKFVLIVSCVTALLYVNSRSERTFSIVVPESAEARDVVQETLVDLRAPKDRVPYLSNCIKSASGVTRLDPILLTCLIHTESRFRKNAVSEKGYRGEAQTKRFSDYSSVNILEGAEILRDKLSLSNGDMFEALARYKGGKDKQEARNQAQQVLKLYRSQLARRGLWNQ
jgi:soluble lytic murein transglycosylase-like protein